MDGTLIGRIVPQVCEYELLARLARPKLKAMRADVVERLRAGVARPHLRAFVRAVTRDPDAAPTELFVYTASEARWAQFLVPCIEEATGVRFNRPLFTRKHCVATHGGADYRKSLGAVAPLVLRALKARYGGALRSAADVRANMLLIDNHPDVLLDPGADGARLVHAPTYGFAFYHDVLGKLDARVVAASFPRLAPFLAKFGLYPAAAPPPATVQDFLQAYYARLARSISEAREENRRPDAFWRGLGRVLRHARFARVDDASARYINAYLEHAAP